MSFHQKQQGGRDKADNGHQYIVDQRGGNHDQHANQIFLGGALLLLLRLTHLVQGVGHQGQGQKQTEDRQESGKQVGGHLPFGGVFVKIVVIQRINQ